MISKTPLEKFKKKFDVVSAFIEHNGEILLLHRQDHKPQGNTWGAPAGKVDEGETLASALAREVEEEIGLIIPNKEYIFFESYHVRYRDYDFMYHVFRLILKEKPSLMLNLKEHKDHVWIEPQVALSLDLIQDEDSCIKWAYDID